MHCTREGYSSPTHHPDGGVIQQTAQPMPEGAASAWNLPAGGEHKIRAAAGRARRKAERKRGFADTRRSIAGISLGQSPGYASVTGRFALIAYAVMLGVAGISIFADPHTFYSIVPGLKLMGPFSIHFIRDVGLAFFAAGGVLFWGAYSRSRGIACAGLSWLLLHAAFHAQIWMHRGFPLDEVFAFDLAAVIAPPIIALPLARNLRRANG